MSWIVLGEEKGKIKLVSKSNIQALLPKGSYLTLEQDAMKFILRVDDTNQIEPYNPSPMIVDMDLSPLHQDQKCKNVITAFRIKDLNPRTDGMIHFIKPQSTARRSNQEEINLALGNANEGPKVFLSTIHSAQNQLLTDEDGKFITAKLPIDMFWHQMLICGKTGSGKTVATKYLAQYFVEKLGGAVLAINVKDIDFLRMDKASNTKDPSVLKEWEMLEEKPHGITNFMVYYPANSSLNFNQGIDQTISEKITLNVSDIEPEALTGLLHGISDVGAQSLPNIFRYWQEEAKKEKGEGNYTFGDFVRYFIDNSSNRDFRTLNHRGEVGFSGRIHPSTFDNIARNLSMASDFFDNKNATPLTEEHILIPNKMSVINVSGIKGFEFGSIVLRDLLHRIVKSKSEGKSKVPVLIIIDEVHHFYGTEALGDLSRICREGRSQQIGVIFSSQNPTDIPKGLSTVINSKFFFKSDASLARMFGVTINSDEMESLKKGFAAASIYDLSQLKILKFPMAFGGVL